MSAKSDQVARNPQSNRHEIILVLDKLQTLVSLGAHCLDADEYNSHTSKFASFLSLSNPHVCLTPPFALTSLEYARRAPQLFTSFAVKRRTPVYSR